MDINVARALIQIQDRRISKLDGKRFIYKGFEYEFRFEGGFACFVGVYRRQIGRRNFKYFDGEGCWDCHTAEEAVKKLTKKLA